MSTVQSIDTSVDVMKSLLWHYNDAVRLQKIVQLKQLWYNQNQSAFWNDWITDVFDLRTANEFGLSVWAIILDVPLSFEAPPSDVTKIGWGFGPQRKNFNHGNFKRSTGGGVTLTTEQKRIVLRLRYFQLTTSANVLEINKFLLSLFGETDGLVYVRDNRNMTCTYIFSFYPPSQLQLVLDEFDLMPRPAGVAFDYTTDFQESFGFGEYRANYGNGGFFNYPLPPTPTGTHNLHLGTNGSDYGMNADITDALWFTTFGSITPPYVPSGTLGTFDVAAFATLSDTTLYVFLEGVQTKNFFTELQVPSLGGGAVLLSNDAGYAVQEHGGSWFTYWNWTITDVGDWATLGDRDAEFIYNSIYQTDATTETFLFSPGSLYAWFSWPDVGGSYQAKAAQGGKMDLYSAFANPLYPAAGAFGDPAIFGRHNGVGIALLEASPGDQWVILTLGNSNGTENYRLSGPCFSAPLDTVDATYHSIDNDASWGQMAYGWNVTVLGWGGTGFDNFTLTNLG